MHINIYLYEVIYIYPHPVAANAPFPRMAASCADRLVFGNITWSIREDSLRHDQICVTTMNSQFADLGFSEYVSRRLCARVTAIYLKATGTHCGVSFAWRCLHLGRCNKNSDDPLVILWLSYTSFLIFTSKSHL